MITTEKSRDREESHWPGPLGLKFRLMTARDYIGFAGAAPDSYICTSGSCTLIWDPQTATLSEIWITDDDRMRQRDWQYEWILEE
jgi:hypothetical protein